MADPIIGSRLFSDGIFRNVLEDELGQYVVNDVGYKVRGAWIVSEEELPQFTSDCGDTTE